MPIKLGLTSKSRLAALAFLVIVMISTVFLVLYPSPRHHVEEARVPGSDMMEVSLKIERAVNSSRRLLNKIDNIIMNITSAINNTYCNLPNDGNITLIYVRLSEIDELYDNVAMQLAKEGGDITRLAVMAYLYPRYKMLNSLLRSLRQDNLDAAIELACQLNASINSIDLIAEKLEEEYGKPNFGQSIFYNIIEKWRSMPNYNPDYDYEINRDFSFLSTFYIAFRDVAMHAVAVNCSFLSGVLNETSVDLIRERVDSFLDKLANDVYLSMVFSYQFEGYSTWFRYDEEAWMYRYGYSACVSQGYIDPDIVSYDDYGYVVFYGMLKLAGLI